MTASKTDLEIIRRVERERLGRVAAERKKLSSSVDLSLSLSTATRSMPLNSATLRSCLCLDLNPKIFFSTFKQNPRHEFARAESPPLSLLFLPPSLPTPTIETETLFTMSPFPPLIGEPSLAGQPEWLDPISVLFLLLGLFFILFGLASHLVRGKFFIPSSVVATLFGEFLVIVEPGSQLKRKWKVEKGEREGTSSSPNSLPSSLLFSSPFPPHHLGILLGPKGLGLLASPATDSGGWSDGSENEEAREFLRWGARLILG